MALRYKFEGIRDGMAVIRDLNNCSDTGGVTYFSEAGLLNVEQAVADERLPDYLEEDMEQIALALTALRQP